MRRPWSGISADRAWPATPLALLLAPASAPAAEPPDPSDSPPPATEPAPEPPAPADIWSRPTLTSDWGGARSSLESRGLTVAAGVTYVFQSVIDGGLDGPLFRAISDESDNGNTFVGDLVIDLDTEKAGLWAGGAFSVRLDGRAGRSIVERAGTIAPVNIHATLPNVVDRFDNSALAITELCYTHTLSETVSIFGGLMNNAAGDANELAGSALSSDHFLNSALLYSLVSDATAPNTSLGGGAELTIDEHLSGSVCAFGTAETAGENPFENWSGTTLSTEWIVSYTLADLPGTLTAGFLYGTGADRANIAQDPRAVLGALLQGLPIPTTDSDTWGAYANLAQFLNGDAERGWGLFLRAGVSDGNPNPVAWNLAGGFGGVGPFPGREGDRWGIGVYYLRMSSEDLLAGLDVDSETGAECFYNLAITPWCRVTLDAQLIDSAIPAADTTLVLGIRTRIIF